MLFNLQTKAQKTDLYAKPFCEISDSAIQYRAKVKTPGGSLSGILLIKHTNSEEYHFVFISELGMTLLEAKIFRDRFEKLYEFDALKRRSAGNLLIEQIKFMLHTFTAERFETEDNSNKAIKTTYKKHKYRCKLDSFQRIVKAKEYRTRFRRKIKYRYSLGITPVFIKMKQNLTGIKWTLTLLHK
ncbi:MAG: hypothetical protein H6605_08255 [Flavobacteriales bacterium]|nr:hypothetical protein [Flavobacteriales bacterium]